MSSLEERHAAAAARLGLNIKTPARPRTIANMFGKVNQPSKKATDLFSSSAKESDTLTSTTEDVAPRVETSNSSEAITQTHEENSASPAATPSPPVLSQDQSLITEASAAESQEASVLKTDVAIDQNNDSEEAEANKVETDEKDVEAFLLAFEGGNDVSNDRTEDTLMTDSKPQTTEVQSQEQLHVQEDGSDEISNERQANEDVLEITPPEVVIAEPETKEAKAPDQPTTKEHKSDSAHISPMDMLRATALTETVLTAELKDLLEGRDLNTISVKEVRAELEQRLGLAAGSLEARREELLVLLKGEVQRIVSLRDNLTPEKASRHSGAKRKYAQFDGLVARPRTRWADGEAAEAEQASEEPLQKISRKDFLAAPSSLCLQVEGQPIQLTAKRFSSGTCGYYSCSRLQVNINGVKRELQLQVNCAVLGSDAWED
jgi:hypothetical protein